MKIYRENTNSYVINLNGNPYEVTIENPLYEVLELERKSNPENFKLNEEPVIIPPSIFPEVEKTEIELLKEKIEIQDGAIIELAEIISSLGGI